MITHAILIHRGSDADGTDKLHTLRPGKNGFICQTTFPDAFP